MKQDDVLATVVWHCNPFRGDKFEALWRPAAAAALDFGATEWALLRSKDDPLDFLQYAVFETKSEWDRYWFSEQISEVRVEAMGLFQVPVLPVWFQVAGTGGTVLAGLDD